MALGAFATLAALIIAASVHAETYTGPIKEFPVSHIGGPEGVGAGAFAFPNGVAVGPSGNVYVADSNNHRVQEFTAGGTFISMFGWEVDKTIKANICTAASKDTCGAAIEGGLGGQMTFDAGLFVDQTTGNVFVQDFSNFRVDEYTAAGEFMLTLGGEVDKTTKANVCTAVSGDVCQAGIQNASQGAFDFEHGGNMLAVGGAEDLLYVGDEHRVQEFDPVTGERKGEISLTSISSEPGSKVVALALDNSCTVHEPAPLTESTSPTCKEFDPEYGDLYLADEVGSQGAGIIHKFTPSGQEIKDGHFPLTLSPATVNAPVGVRGVAVDPVGRLALAEEERLEQGFRLFDGIYSASTGYLEAESAVASVSLGLTFNRKSELYAASAEFLRFGEVIAYAPRHVAELVVKPQACVPASEVETDVQLNCKLNGEVNPEEVPGTEAFFEWGRSPALGTSTPRQVLCTTTCGSTLGAVSATVEGVRPNESSFFYRIAGYDQNVPPSERALFSEPASFTTPLVAAWVGGTSAQFVKSSSVVLLGELNPENASTRYAYQYATSKACEAAEHQVEHTMALSECPGVTESLTRESPAYGKIHITAELSGLQPATAYRYRMVTLSRNTAGTETRENAGPEAQVTTAPGAQPQAETGGTSGVGVTSATIMGAVNPDGQPVTYSFELGVYAGAGTQYGVLTSGTVPAGTVPVGEAFAASGLQPGTTYAYRIKVAAPGFGEAFGTPVLFTTEGLPAVLAVPASLGLLAMPEGVTFPQESPVGIATPKKLTRAQQLARALETCKKKRNSRQRASCERSARKKYGTKSKRK
jgi:NHL repeat